MRRTGQSCRDPSSKVFLDLYWMNSLPAVFMFILSLYQCLPCFVWRIVNVFCHHTSCTSYSIQVYFITTRCIVDDPQCIRKKCLLSCVFLHFSSFRFLELPKCGGINLPNVVLTEYVPLGSQMNYLVWNILMSGIGWLVGVADETLYIKTQRSKLFLLEWDLTLRSKCRLMPRISLLGDTGN